MSDFELLESTQPRLLGIDKPASKLRQLTVDNVRKAQAMGLGLSASTIKSWFQYRCERKTRYELMDAADRAAVPVIQDDREKPWADLGVDYEKRVLARLARRTRILVPGASEDGLGERIAAAFLRGEQ